jgi:hypothetical protein
VYDSEVFSPQDREPVREKVDVRYSSSRELNERVNRLTS